MDYRDNINSYFICATQYINLGDLIINKMLVDELSKYGKVFIDTAGVPDNFKNPLFENVNVQDMLSYGISGKRLSIKSLIKLIRFFKKNNIKVLTRSPGPLYSPTIRVHAGFLLLNIIARLCGLQVIYFGNCCSGASLNREKIKPIFANKILLRSIHSVEYASKQFGTKVSFIPDLAFLLSHNCNVAKKKKVIVDYRQLNHEGEIPYLDICTIIRDFLKAGYAVELYYQVLCDEQETLFLYNQLKDDGVTIRRELLWYNDIENYYSDKAFVISNRLHSLLIGAAYGVIPIARISHDPKVSKIEHVFQSSLPEQFSRYVHLEDVINISSYIENEALYRDQVSICMKDNAKFCSEIIKNVLNDI